MSDSPYSPPRESLQTPMPTGPGFVGRPTSVTVLAIICFFFGGIGLLAIPFNVWMFLNLDSRWMENNPAVDSLKNSSVYYVFSVASIVIGTLVCVWLIWIGIGLLKQREIARRHALFYAAYVIVFTVISTYFNYEFVQKPIFEAQNLPMAFAIGSMVFGFGFAMLFPAALFFFLQRPHVRATFSERGV